MSYELQSDRTYYGPTTEIWHQLIASSDGLVCEVQKKSNLSVTEMHSRTSLQSFYIYLVFFLTSCIVGTHDTLFHFSSLKLVGIPFVLLSFLITFVEKFAFVWSTNDDVYSYMCLLWLYKLSRNTWISLRFVLQKKKV